MFIKKTKNKRNIEMHTVQDYKLQIILVWQTESCSIATDNFKAEKSA